MIEALHFRDTMAQMSLDAWWTTADDRLVASKLTIVSGIPSWQARAKCSTAAQCCAALHQSLVSSVVRCTHRCIGTFIDHWKQRS
jgi:hypothetical protein